MISVADRARLRQEQDHSSHVHADAINDCESAVALIGDYLSASLPAARHQAFEAHLIGCKDCAAFFSTYKKTLALTRTFLNRAGATHHLSFGVLRAIASGH